jgi:multicomponent Na+:H+ antiporter subunit A
VAVLIETVIAVLFLGVFALLPRSALRRLSSLRTSSRRRWRDPLIAIAAGAAAFLVVWGVLSRPSVAESVAAEHLRLAPDAHAKDVVTAILADFRGLDTLGEITVVGVALLGSVILFARRRVP